MLTPSEALMPVERWINDYRNQRFPDEPMKLADGTAAIVALVVAELGAMVGGHVSGCPCSPCYRLAAWRALTSEPAGGEG